MRPACTAATCAVVIPSSFRSGDGTMTSAVLSTDRDGLHSGAMPLGTDYAGQDCSLARALEVVGERWTLLVLRDCFFGVRRFSDLRAHLDISRAVLSARLADLVEAGLLARREPAPGRVEYELTEQGLALW